MTIYRLEDGIQQFYRKVIKRQIVLNISFQINESKFSEEVYMVVIAIDGPSGAGKSSASRAIASHFHWKYLDTGALYRTLTLCLIERELSEPAELANLLTANSVRWHADPHAPAVYLENRAVNEQIRSNVVTSRVSEVAADPEVRAFLLSLQRSIINQSTPGIVVEGRDIGTTVWPDAELKIFLTADLQARAERRNAELAANLSDVEVSQSLAARDVVDSSRSASPLRQTEEQVVIDATHLSLEEVVAQIKRLIIELGLSNE